jgi:nitrogen regulatory protein PII
MAKLVMLITTHVEKGLAVAEAWEAAGAPGVTLIDSYGLHDLREKSKSVEIPLFVSMARVMRQIEQTNQTILAVVDDDLVDTLIDAACVVLGTKSLDAEGDGVAFVLPVDRTIGIRSIRPKSAE